MLKRHVGHPLGGRNLFEQEIFEGALQTRGMLNPIDQQPLQHPYEAASVDRRTEPSSSTLLHATLESRAGGFHRFKLNANFPHRPHCQSPPMPNKGLYRDESQS